MLFGGIVILLGIIIPELTLTSFVVAILLFGDYAIGMLLSFGIDGKPNKLIIQGLATEVVLGSANLFCLINILV